MKILTFSDIFNFQMYLRRKTVFPFIKSAYINLTVKETDVVSSHTKISGSDVNLTVISHCTITSHASQLLPTRVLLNSIFRGAPVNTSTTKKFFQKNILKRDGNCWARGRSPNHTSSQSRVFSRFPILKEPLDKKSSFTPTRPF
jgi:hypothetical protein